MILAPISLECTLEKQMTDNRSNQEACISILKKPQAELLE